MRRVAFALVLCSGAGAGAADPARATKASPIYLRTVRATVDAHLDEMAACVDTSKVKRGAADVRLDVQVMILSDGAVLSARRGGSATRGDGPVERCLLDKVRRWHFPPPPDRQTVAVDFPIVLQLVGPDGKP